MAHAGVTRKRARLRGWLRYTPFLAVPFAVLATETWLHHTRIQNDYETGAIRRDLRQVSSRIDELTDDIARLENLDRMQSQVPDLGLVLPTPTQVRVVNIPRNGVAPRRAERGLELAQLEIISDELLIGTTQVD